MYKYNPDIYNTVAILIINKVNINFNIHIIIRTYFWVYQKYHKQNDKYNKY